MSEALLDYINNILQYSHKIKLIEREFRNGFLFGELLEKSGYIKGKLSKYIEKPKNNSEIKENFNSLKKDLKLIDIFLNDSTINDIMSGKEGVAAKLLYKIKTELNRIKINFNDIVGKINENSYREKFELSKSKNNINFNKTKLLELTQTNKFSMSPSITTRETLSTFTNFFLKPKNKVHKHILLSDDNKTNLSNVKFPTLQNKIKLVSIKPNNKNFEQGKMFKSSKTTIGFTSLVNNEYKSPFENQNILEKINDEDEKSKASNLCLSIPDTNISNKKLELNKYRTHSLFEQKKGNIKYNATNYKNNNIFNYDRYIKYSVFDNNAKKLGININEITPKLKKSGISYNKDYYLSSKQIIGNFKNILASKKKDYKNKFGNLLINENKNSLKDNFLKNSIINQHYEENKLFSTRFKKNSSQYKMHEYNNLINSKNKNYNKINKKYFIINNSYEANQDENKEKYFDVDEYINIVNDEDKMETSMEKNLKIQKNLKNYENIKGILNLIVDFSEQCYKSQIKLEEELIEIPEYREWSKSFIEGKSCLKIPIKKRRDKNDNMKQEKDSGIVTNNSSILTKFTKKSNEKKKEKKTNLNISELTSMEYYDYMFYRGNWEINDFVNKNSYGKYLHLYNILENDIFNIIPNVNSLFHGLKPSQLLEKNNSEFELNEEELNNIFVPKSNIRNSLLGEIILLNFDNISNEAINNNLIHINSADIKLNSKDQIEEKNNNEEQISMNNKEEKSSININDNDFSHIPIKLCFIGHSFSGRKTQAKLLCEKYNNLKSYSINEISLFYLNEYKRLHTPIEKNPKNKSLKKNQIGQMKEEIENEIIKYKDIFSLIEKYLNINKNKIEDFFSNLNIEEIPDELKINLFLNQIKKDFPKKSEKEISEQIQSRILKKQELEKEINKLKQEMENEPLNHKNGKDIKKSKQKPKTSNNANNIQKLTEELENIINQSFEGFILYDYPYNYTQYLKLENIITGFTQIIDKSPDKRDIYINILTNSIDKPYINISNLNKEAFEFLNNNPNNKKFNQDSFFNCYILLELSEEETLKRMKNRLKDPNTGIIYHKEYSPPPPGDKKLNDRLVEIKDPNEEEIKDLLTQYYLEYPKILYFVNLFNNLYRINDEKKDDIFKKIEEIIFEEIKKFEERENKDTMGNLINNFENNDENELIRYFQRLNEIKKKISKDFSESFIKNWYEEQDKYNKGIRVFIKNFEEIKFNILEEMNLYQEEFIDYINSSSKKYKLVDIFYQKYNKIIEKFPYLKNNHLIKEEFEKNINELIDHMWEMIKMRKNDSINELNNIKNQHFIENQLEFFGKCIIKLFILETSQYYNKINLIKKFYFEFEKPGNLEKFPYEYKFNQESILENINEYSIFISDSNSSISKTTIISPKIDKIYKNCYKLFFVYDKEMNLIQTKLKEEFNMNQSGSSGRQKRKLKSYLKKNTVKSDKSVSVVSDTRNLINYTEEKIAALSNEKRKYKIKILFLKNFAEKNLKEIYNIGEITFNSLDNHIIDSVNNQNTAMNELILKIRKNIKEGVFKLNIKDVELDLFDIYEKTNANFPKFNINYLYMIPDSEKTIKYSDLYMIFLDTKNYEIQKNYINMNIAIDIIFKKHLFEYKSGGFMKYMQKIPFYYLNTYIIRYATKKEGGYTVIKLNELFTSLALLNKVPPKNEQQLLMLKSIKEKLQHKRYLSKNDFMNCKMWYEKEESNNQVNVNYGILNSRSSAINLTKNNNINNILNEIIFKDKKPKRASLLSSNNINDMINNELSEEQKLKEFLFNVNKNEDNLIDFSDLMKRINIKRSAKKKKTTKFMGVISDVKSNLDKADILSQNSFVESVDKTQMSESTTNYFKGSKILGANNNINNLKEEAKVKIYKSQKFNDTFRDFSEQKNNNNNINEIINFPEYTFFDYYFKKS